MQYQLYLLHSVTELVEVSRLKRGVHGLTHEIKENFIGLAFITQKR